MNSASVAAFGQVVMGSYSLLQILVFVIIIAAGCAITVLILRTMGIAIPDTVTKILWILAAAFLGIFALVFLFRTAGAM